MYYVTLIGKIYIRARGPEFDDPLGEMEDVKIFDFDDEIKWSDAALDFEYKRVSAGKNYDPFAMTAINDEKGRRAGEMSAPWFDDMNEMLDDFARSEDFEDFDEFDDFVSDWYEDRKPIITQDDISFSAISLIRKLAANERKRWKYLGKPAKDQAEAKRREEEFENDFWLRLQLMDEEFVDELVDDADPVEDMKIVAAHLMFLYAQERQNAETEGRKADEDYFYAAANLYNFAALSQILDEDDSFEFDD